MKQIVFLVFMWDYGEKELHKVYSNEESAKKYIGKSIDFEIIEMEVEN